MNKKKKVYSFAYGKGVSFQGIMIKFSHVFHAVPGSVKSANRGKDENVCLPFIYFFLENILIRTAFSNLQHTSISNNSISDFNIQNYNSLKLIFNRLFKQFFVSKFQCFFKIYLMTS